MKRTLTQFDNSFYFVIFVTALLLVALMPFYALYKFSNVMSLFLRLVVRYRVQTIRRNLINSFPEKSKDEVRMIIKQSYRNLADIAIEALKGFTLTRKQLLKRYRIINPELLSKYYEKGQSVIGLSGHLNNWEWGALAAALQIKHRPIAFYKQLSNPFIDRLMKWTRAKKGTTLVPIRETESTFFATRNEKCLYILIADQSPVDLTKAFWVNFFNQDTPCLHGPEKYGHLYNYPLIFIGIRRVRRGYYQVELTELCQNPRSLAPGEITKMYMNKLEDFIRENPACWLWSHRRWKRKHPKYKIYPAEYPAG